jgi:hypothetical protein
MKETAGQMPEGISAQISPYERRLAYTIQEFVRSSGVGRTATYEALNDGRLKAVKAGTRTLILGDSARAFITSLPAYRPQAAS